MAMRNHTNADRNSPETILSAKDLSVYYGQNEAIHSIDLDFPRYHITAIIGPSGCGKSTLIRCFNRMNDLVPSAQVEGEVIYHGQNIYAPDSDPVRIRRQIGMVFQKPNPFPKSIYENIAFSAKINGFLGNIDDLVEKSLRQAALWDEVKDELDKSGLALSGGQQQRLCIARALATEPQVLLMDEPASALDPISTLKIEELMRELREHYTIIIVTHNMQQASRVSDYTAFLSIDRSRMNERVGVLVEYDATEKIFINPAKKETEDYISGRFG